MRPKLRGDTLYVPIPEGVYLRNNRGVLRIPGKHVYQWVERLAPYLDGTHTLDELTDELSVDRQQMVAQLIEMLTEGGFVKDAQDDRPHTLSPAEARAYAPEIAFIDYFCDSAAHRFQTFRQTRIAVVGSGLTLTALVAATLHVGVRNLHVVVTGECPTDRQKHQEHLQTARQRDPDQRLTEQTVTDWDADEPAARAVLRPFDAVVHVCDRPMLARARTLDRICQAERKVFVQAVVVGDQAWIGPLVDPEEAGGWESAWRRLQATRTGSAAARGTFAFADDPATPVSGFLTAPTAAIVANHLSFAVFKHLTGIPAAETRSPMLCVDLQTLQTQSRQFLPHPSTLPLDRAAQPTAEAFLEHVRGLERNAPLDEQDFSQRAPACIDDELGLLTGIDEGDLHQLPLHVCRVTISNPALLPGPDEPIIAVGVGTDLGMARRRAAQRACELYAASVIDERRFVQADGQGVQVWGFDLAEQRPRLVPAAQVFPTLDGLTPSAATAPWLASGFSWAEAVSNALVSVCQQVTVTELDTGNGRLFPLVDLQTVPLDEQGARYRRILRTWGVTVDVYEVTGALGIPTFAFCVGDHTVAYRSDVDPQDALRCGLEQTLAYEQARANHQPDYAPVEVRDLPQRVRGSQPILVQPGGTGAWSDQQHQLTDALTRHGRRVTVVPLGHDPAVTDVLPYIVNLVVEPC